MVRKLVTFGTILACAGILALGSLRISETSTQISTGYAANPILTKWWLTPPSYNHYGPMFLCSGSMFDLEKDEGWPLHYVYLDVTAPGCSDSAYPLLYFGDVLFYGAVLLAGYAGVRFAKAKYMHRSK